MIEIQFIIIRINSTSYHDILFKKLYRYGISGKALDFFQHYFSSITQIVRKGDINIRNTSVTVGVPQRLILRPLLLYINNLFGIPPNENIILEVDYTAI